MPVQRAAERFLSRGEGWEGRYCFSYGEHYDSGNVSFGHLVACNEFRIEPGHGFGEHHHAGIEVVSWVLEGTLLHDGQERVERGGLQVLSTGTGIEHSETNPGPGPLRLLQMWLVPAEQGPPRHALVGAPGGFGPLDLPLRQPGARLHAGTLPAGTRVALPQVPFVFLLVTDGSVTVGETVGEQELGPGDSARLTEPSAVTATTDARLLVWAMDGD